MSRKEDFPPESEDWKNFVNNNSTTALILFIKNNAKMK